MDGGGRLGWERRRARRVQGRVVRERRRSGLPGGVARWGGATTWTPAGASPPYASALAEYNGALHAANGPSVLRWDGAADGEWSMQGTYFQSPVSVLATCHGKLYAGGAFYASGSDYTIIGIAQWDGETWSGVGYKTNGIVNALAVLGDSLYVGGRFSVRTDWIIGSTSNIARWDGTSWAALGATPPLTVTAVAVSNWGLFIASETSVPGKKTLLRWDTASEQWLQIGEANGNVQALVATCLPGWGGTNCNVNYVAVYVCTSLVVAGLIAIAVYRRRDRLGSCGDCQRRRKRARIDVVGPYADADADAEGETWRAATQQAPETLTNDQAPMLDRPDDAVQPWLRSIEHSKPTAQLTHPTSPGFVADATQVSASNAPEFPASDATEPLAGPALWVEPSDASASSGGKRDALARPAPRGSAMSDEPAASVRTGFRLLGSPSDSDDDDPPALPGRPAVRKRNAPVEADRFAPLPHVSPALGGTVVAERPPPPDYDAAPEKALPPAYDAAADFGGNGGSNLGGPVQGWTTAQTGVWLQRRGLAEVDAVTTAFQREGIQGRHLKVLTNDSLKDLGVLAGDRMTIMFQRDCLYPT